MNTQAEFYRLLVARALHKLTDKYTETNCMRVCVIHLFALGICTGRCSLAACVFFQPTNCPTVYFSSLFSICTQSRLRAGSHAPCGEFMRPLNE